MDVSGFVRAEAKKIESHVKYDVYKWIAFAAGGFLLTGLYALSQKMRHLSVDWYVAGGLFVVASVVYTVALWALRRQSNSLHPVSTRISATSVSDMAESLVTDTGMEVGLTFDFAEVERQPDNSPQAFKCKLWVYWTNDGEETIHLGVPLLRGVAIQGNDLAYTYQLKQQNPAQSWGDFIKETDVTPGRRCRIWLGLDQSLRDSALKLLNGGQLGLLVIPVTISKRTVNVCVRPRDRGLMRFNGLEYNELKKAVYDRHINQCQAAKALLAFVCLRHVVSEALVVEHFQQYKIPNPEKTLSDLRNDSVPFLGSSAEDIKLTPALEKIIVETVRTDEAEFRQMFAKMTGQEIGNRIKNEPGFEGRVNALLARPPL
jgi:hypothetical protein